MRDAQTSPERVKGADMVKAFIVSGEYRGRFGGDNQRGQQFGSIAEALPPSGWWNSFGSVVAALRVSFFTSFPSGPG